MLALVVNLFISVGLIVIGLTYFIKRARFKRKFRSSVSRVTSVETEFDSETFVKYPIIKFIANGKEIITKVDFGMTIFQWKKGDEIKIFYNPENPKDLIVDELKVKLLSWAMIIFGCIAFLIGFYYL